MYTYIYTYSYMNQENAQTHLIMYRVTRLATGYKNFHTTIQSTKSTRAISHVS